MSASAFEALPAGAYAAALAGLPGIGPATLSRLLASATPEEAWADVVAGRVQRPARGAGRARAGAGPIGEGGRPDQDDLRLPFEGTAGATSPREVAAGDGSWAAAARLVDVADLWARCRRSAIRVTWRGGPLYPTRLASDPEPPGVLFWRGDLASLSRRCVAIVGTRHCSPDGRLVALEMGRDLAHAGACVVSGLALGIDGAAHAGALEAASAAGPVGVAASGVDRPYPRQHRDLWERVVATGAVVSETPPGAPAQAWRFPARNRIIAALAEMVVVVESHRAGGSMLTVEAALARGVEVRAVPGAVRSRASEGTNQLLCDGAAPVRHASDVLDAMGLVGLSAPAAAAGRPDRLGAREQRVLNAGAARPTSPAQVGDHSGGDGGVVAAALDSLEDCGMVCRAGAWWLRAGA
ncbi:MAG: DNA-processing protein DprA [Acidimicrobiales bacterium]